MDAAWKSQGVDCQSHPTPPGGLQTAYPWRCKDDIDYLHTIDQPSSAPEAYAELSRIRPSHVRVSTEYGGGFIADVEGLHHLHCLVRDLIGYCHILGAHLLAFNVKTLPDRSHLKESMEVPISNHKGTIVSHSRSSSLTFHIILFDNHSSSITTITLNKGKVLSRIIFFSLISVSRPHAHFLPTPFLSK